ncbi:mitochondrial fission ELM1 family protein, partial [bacterium]|nr:mitochondrial fission ELM1 family protein [bacterium]
TPVELESQIETLASKFPSLSWLLLWHRDRRNPLYAMFARSKLAIVTSDSVSMIAESATAGKGPLVFRASKTCGGNVTKQDRMVEGLFKAGFGSLAEGPESLNEILIKMLSGESNFPVLDDTHRAADKLLELIQGISR